MKILDVVWFSGSSHLGIVKVETDYEGIKYYIGAPPFHSASDEATDSKWIADWGSTFPEEAGDALFDSKFKY